MNKNHIIIIILVIVIIALSALVGISLLGNQKDNVIVYNNTIKGVGTFNTTNVTNFTFDYAKDGTDYYIANDSKTQVSVTGDKEVMEITKDDSERVNDSAAGHTIYKTTATVGKYKGEVRYVSFLENGDKNQYIYLGSPDYNVTCMMVDTFRMF